MRCQEEAKGGRPHAAMRRGASPRVASMRRQGKAEGGPPHAVVRRQEEAATRRRASCYFSSSGVLLLGPMGWEEARAREEEELGVGE
jgi:hypothetical protein